MGIRNLPERFAWPVALIFGAALWFLAHNPILWAQYFDKPAVIATDERTVTIEEDYFGGGRTMASRTRQVTRDLGGRVEIVTDWTNSADPTAPRTGQTRLQVVDGEVIGRAVTGPQAGLSRRTALKDEPDGKRFGALTSIGTSVTHCQGGTRRKILGLEVYGPTNYEALIGGPDAEPRRRQRFSGVYRAPALGCYAVRRDVDTELEEGVFTRTEERRLRFASRSVQPNLLER